MAYRKPKKRASPLLLLGIAAILLLLAGATLHFYQKSARPVSQLIPPPSNPAPPHVPAPVGVNRGLPVRLKVPKINIDANVLYMGLTKAGAMDTPTNVVDVGWYKLGPLPGNTGSAVIAGHIDGLRGEPGVFSNLDKLQAGDTLSVTDTTGQATSFVVHEVRIYDQNEQPPEVFSSSDGAHLNLISCTGTWDAAQHHFLKRRVVFTDKSS